MASLENLDWGLAFCKRGAVSEAKGSTAGFRTRVLRSLADTVRPLYVVKPNISARRRARLKARFLILEKEVSGAVVRSPAGFASKDSRAVGGILLYPRVNPHWIAIFTRSNEWRWRDLGPARLAHCHFEE